MVPLTPLVHASAEERASTRKVYLIRLPIAGFYYHDGMDDEIFESLALGYELELRREPENPHDANAIAVYTQYGHKLGYVPMVENPIPAAIADQNVAIGAEICALEAASEDYHPVMMRLYMIIPDTSQTDS